MCIILTFTTQWNTFAVAFAVDHCTHTATIHTHVTCTSTHVSIKHFCVCRNSIQNLGIFSSSLFLLFLFTINISIHHGNIQTDEKPFRMELTKIWRKKPKKNSSNNGRIFNLFICLWVASHLEWWKFDRKGGGGVFVISFDCAKEKRFVHILWI